MLSRKYCAMLSRKPSLALLRVDRLLLLLLLAGDLLLLLVVLRSLEDRIFLCRWAHDRPEDNLHDIGNDTKHDQPAGDAPSLNDTSHGEARDGTDRAIHPHEESVHAASGIPKGLEKQRKEGGDENTD